METSDFAQEMSVTSGQRVIEKLSSTGGTCDTYRVRINGKWHFMKRPRKGMSSNTLYITAFEREFDIGYRLEHKSLVRYIDKGVDEQGIYILTEMIDGCTLDEFVTKNPEYFKDKKHFKEFVSQMLDVLDYLHNNQVLHLDLKPSNIMITRMGRNVKLVDLGFAYSECYHDIATGMTSEYAAPEQLAGGDVGPWTDIYALGKVMFAMFNNGKLQGSFKSLPLHYRNFVKKCVEHTPNQRFLTVADAQHYLSKKHSNHKLLIVGILISIVTFLLILWGIINASNTDSHQVAKENSIITKSDDSIENMADFKPAEEAQQEKTQQERTRQEKALQEKTQQEKTQISQQNKHNKEAEINSKSESTEFKQTIIVTVPETLKSQLHARAKAAFNTLERKYIVIDDYKTRSNLMIEIKETRRGILEYAKSLANDNESTEKYYNVAIEILNEEFEHSNLPNILNTKE